MIKRMSKKQYNIIKYYYITMTIGEVPIDFPMQIIDQGRIGRSIVIPGAYMYSQGSYSIPIYSSCNDTRVKLRTGDTEEGVIVLPKFKLQIFQHEDYGSAYGIYDNTNGSEVVYYDTGKSGEAGAVKLWYKGNEITQSAMSEGVSTTTTSSGRIFYTQYDKGDSSGLRNTRIFRQAGYESGNSTTSKPTDGYLTSNGTARGKEFPFSASGSDGSTSGIKQSQCVPGAWLLQWNTQSLPVFGSVKFGQLFFNDRPDTILLLPHFGVRMYGSNNHTGSYDEYKNNTGELIYINSLFNNNYSSVKLYYRQNGFSANHGGYSDALEGLDEVNWS
jgi:hypothetical protein